MDSLPANPPPPVRESILEIGDVDEHSWIVGDRFIISLQPTAPTSGPYWSDGAGAFFVVSELESQAELLPRARRPLAPTGRITLVNDAGDANAAWRIGEAFLKVQKQSNPRRTREHTTLNFLRDPANGVDLTASIPRVLYHAEFDGRYYLITTRIPGETLEKAWPTMDEAAKQACVDQVVTTCRELGRKESDTICGIDGGELLESWIGPIESDPRFSHEALLSHCRAVGMTDDTFVLHHCDMGPTNVLVDLADGGCRVGIIDWEMVGYVPKTWVRTKFCVCGAMWFDFAADDAKKAKDWIERLQLRLGREGFPEVAEAWTKRFRESYEASR